MGREVPPVVKGARSADKTGKDGSHAEQQKAPPAPDFGRPRNRGLESHQHEYHSAAGNLFLQLRNPRTIEDQDGNKTVQKGLYLKFRQGRAVVDSSTEEGAEAVARIEGVEPNKVYPKGLKPHPQFGLGRDFWRADEASEKARKASVEAAIATVKASVAQHPEILDQVLGELGASEFDLEAEVEPPAPAPDTPPASE